MPSEKPAKAPAKAPTLLGPGGDLYYKLYSVSMLNVYDAMILGLSMSYAWNCPTEQYLEPFFRAHFSKNHLDLGVGSGYFPAKTLEVLGSSAPRDPAARGFHASQTRDSKAPQRVALLDLNPTALRKTKRRVEVQGASRGLAPVLTVRADAIVPVPVNAPALTAKFDSVSAFLLLHCIPAPTPVKAAGLVANARRLLNPDGVFVGCTVLGRITRTTSTPADIIDWLPRRKHGKTVVDFGPAREAQMAFREGLLGRFLISAYGLVGIFANAEDGPDEIVDALEREFEVVDTWIIGRMMLFRGRKPKAD